MSRFRILAGVYRGKVHTHARYLARALKIIMHVSAAYTKHHRQRRHGPLVPISRPPLPPPDVDTGTTIADLRRNMLVSVRWLDDWWAARIQHISVQHQRVTVKLVGEDVSTPGILPRHIRLHP